MGPPTNRAAFIPGKGKRLEVRDAPYPRPGPNDIVIKNAAVAINPVDWKQQDHDIFIQSYPSIFGVDVSGVVEEVGEAVTVFAKGDRVIANPSCLSLGDKYGAFQLYVLSPTNVACKIPESMAFESAVVLPLAINTSGSGLFKKGSLELPKPSITPKSTDIWILVYGGSTSNGSTALQLAKAAGVNVLAVAGMKNHDLCRQLGATDVVDYKDPKWIYETTDRLLGKHVVGAYDSVGTDATTKAIDEVLKAANFDVSIISTGFIPAGIKGLLAFGTDATKDPELAKALWEDFLPSALANGSFVPKPDFEVVGHGLEDIQQAMDMQKKGVSAKKLVVKMT